MTAAAQRLIALAIAVAGVVVLVDVATKHWLRQEFGPDSTRTAIGIVGAFVELRPSENSGVAFGLMQGRGSGIVVLVALVLVPLTAVLLSVASRGLEWSIGAGLVLGGAYGNLVDRIGDGRVTDFISVGRWPSFNLADSAITVGALLLLVLFVRASDGDRRSQIDA